jgi:hypothetical protein
MSSFMCNSCRKIYVTNQTPSRLQRRLSLILQGGVDCCCLLDNFCPYMYLTDCHSGPRSFTHPYENYITTHFCFTSLTNKCYVTIAPRLSSIHDNLLTNWVIKTEDIWLGPASSLQSFRYTKRQETLVANPASLSGMKS